MTSAADLRAWWSGALATVRIMSRYPGYIVSTTVWPVMLPAVYIVQARAFAGGSQAAGAAFAHRAGTASVAGFLVVGYAMYMWLSNVLWGPGTELRQRQVQGQLEALYVTPTSRAAILFAPSGGFFAFALITFAVSALTMRLAYGVLITPEEGARAIAVTAVAVFPMFGLGALFSVAVLILREINGSVQLLRGIFQVFCGMTFPIVVLPDWARAIALTMPPTHILAAVRAVLLSGASLASVLPSLVVLTVSGVVLSVGGVAAFRVAERYARRTGALGQY